MASGVQGEQNWKNYVFFFQEPPVTSGEIIIDSEKMSNSSKDIRNDRETPETVPDRNIDLVTVWGYPSEVNTGSLKNILDLDIIVREDPTSRDKVNRRKGIGMGEGGKGNVLPRSDKETLIEEVTTIDAVRKSID